MADVKSNVFLMQNNEQIGTLLQQEQLSLKSLLAILEEENISINNHDLTQLEDITERKKQLVASVEKASKDRMIFLQTLGIDTHKNGWSHQLDKALGQDPFVSEPLSQLLDVTQKCQGLNRTNGLALNHKQQLTTKLMCLLRDDIEAETYSGRGMAESNSEHRILGKA